MSERLVESPAPEVPPGFRLGPGGLLVPIGASALEREVWRWEDGMAMVRAQKVAELHGVMLMVGCNDPRCAENPLIQQVLSPDGGFLWRCRHKERVVSKGPKGRR